MPVYLVHHRYSTQDVFEVNLLKPQPLSRTSSIRYAIVGNRYSALPLTPDEIARHNACIFVYAERLSMAEITAYLSDEWLNYNLVLWFVEEFDFESWKRRLIDTRIVLSHIDTEKRIFCLAHDEETLEEYRARAQVRSRAKPFELEASDFNRHIQPIKDFIQPVLIHNSQDLTEKALWQLVYCAFYGTTIYLIFDPSNERTAQTIDFLNTIAWPLIQNDLE